MNLKKSLLKAVERLNLKGLFFVGQSINGVRESGNIIVQTPHYLRPGHINVIDEFHALSFKNMRQLTTSKMWNELILMSATPYVPIYKGALQAGCSIK